VKSSNGTDDLLKNNTVTYSCALQQVQIHALNEIKVIHHIDLNDIAASKKKKSLHLPGKSNKANQKLLLKIKH